MDIPIVTYSDIKNMKPFNNSFTIILVTEDTTANSYFLELNIKDILIELFPNISVFKIIDNKELIKDYRISSEASILFFTGSKLEDIILGNISKIALLEKLKKLISISSNS